MKRILSYSIFSILLLLGACRKTDNPKIPTLIRVPTPNLVQGTGDLAISISTYEIAKAFNTNFSVALKFPNDVPPTKMDVVVRKNGNNTNVKVWQAGITTWPTTINVTGNKIIAAFGDSLRLNDNYDFGVDIYAADGKKYEAFPLVGAGSGAGLTGQFGGDAVNIRYSVICGYNPDDYQGNFVVVEDGWQDTNPGDIIVFTKIDATHFSFIYPSVINPVPIIVTVNTNTNGVSIAKQSIGLRFNYGAAYVLPTVRSSGDPNLVAPCDKTISMSLIWGYTGLEGGPYPFTLKKQ